MHRSAQQLSNTNAGQHIWNSVCRSQFHNPFECKDVAQALGKAQSSAMGSQEPRNCFKSVYNDSFLLASRISKTLCKEPHNCFIILLLRVGFSAIVLENCLWPQYWKRSLLQYFWLWNYSRNSGSKSTTSFSTVKEKPDKISSTP